MSASYKRLSGRVIEVDGMLWKPRRGAKSSAEEFIAAHQRLCELLDERDWNPWNRDALDTELHQVDAIREQWTRAEEGFRPYSDEEFEAWAAQSQHRAEQHCMEREHVRAERRARYDESLDAARLALLEKQAILDHYLNQKGTTLGEKLYPNLEEKIHELDLDVTHLRAQVGDPELVVDRNGWVPQERREQLYWEFRWWRQSTVEQLIDQIPQRTTIMKQTTDRAEKSSLRTEIAFMVSKRDALMAVPRPRTEEMCSECAVPHAWHGWTSNGTMALLGAGPCPAWPGWSVRIRRARQMLMEGAARKDTLAKPAPQPLAVIPSGLTIDEVVTRLEELRQKYPTAQVRRGNRNRWEIWPQDQNTQPRRADS